MAGAPGGLEAAPGGGLKGVLDMNERADTSANGGKVIRLDGEMAEVLLLLPNEEADALEQAARQRDLTAAQLVRRLIRDFLDPRLPGRRPRPSV